MQVRHLNIIAEISDILSLLKTHLVKCGINKLETIKYGQNNVQVSCPVHNNGMENHASCGILTESKENMPAGTTHCFACGFKSDLAGFISECFNKHDNGIYGLKWLTANFGNTSGKRPDILNFKETKNNITYITEKELDSYRYYHPYMFKRGLTKDIIEKYDIGYDKNTNCITMPVRDIKGNTLFICRRSVISKFFNYLEFAQKPVYGLFELDYSKDTVIVCESVFNALTCVKYGFQAVAFLGTGTDYQYQQIKKLPMRNIILGFDGDNAGDIASQRFINNIKNKFISKLILPRGKDINDLGKAEFDSLKQEKVI